MMQPTQLQKNQMIFRATFRSRQTVTEAISLLDWLMEITDMESLAEQLRFAGFISDYEAIQLAKGKGWIVAEMPQEKFDRYIKPSRFGSKL